MQISEIIRKAVDEARRTMGEGQGGPFGAAIIDPEGKTLIHSVSTQPGEQETWLYEPKTYKVKVSAIQASWNLHIETLDDFKAGERK